MLEIAHKEGIQHIIATPHYGVCYQNPDVTDLKMKLELVRQEAVKIDESFQIDLGNELFYSEEIIDHLQMKKALTLADTRYVLVEFLYSENYNNIKAGLYKLLISGYLPILAHVERYECLNQDIDLIKDLTEMGALMQMNISSILGGITKRRASLCKKLMTKSLVHFIGTTPIRMRNGRQEC
jgi:protein-tyrosine phosphatase